MHETLDQVYSDKNLGVYLDPLFHIDNIKLNIIDNINFLYRWF